MSKNLSTAIESKNTPFYSSSNTKIKGDAADSLVIRKAYVDVFPVELPRGLDNLEDAEGKEIVIENPDLPASASNPYFNVRLRTIGGNNYPLSDEASAEQPELYREVTAQVLIANPRGASIYVADDFLYVKQFGKLPLNRLITLRRFAHPVFDDIFSVKSQSEPDISRMLTFSDQDTNKLSEILSFSVGMRWKDLKSESEKAEMSGDQNGVGGLVGKALKFVDPKFGREAVEGPNKLAIDPQHDNNRVYGPVDSIDSTMIREVGLDFSHSIELQFDYEMKSINGVNQKAAFVDLLSNILMMYTNDAKFWGGARYWVGPQPSKYVKDLKMLSPTNFTDFVTKSTEGMKAMLGKFANKASAKETLMNIANNAMNLALGSLLNKLGRPAIPVMNSLLTGNPIGPWHLTIGNPNNPIMCAGDIIVRKAEISFGDELGYDDFPTTITVKVAVEHPKAKGRAEIESMFNAGKGRTYMKPKSLHGRHKSASTRIPSLTQPTTIGAVSLQADSAIFGDYKSTDVERSGPAVWSFLKNSN